MKNVHESDIKNQRNILSFFFSNLKHCQPTSLEDVQHSIRMHFSTFMIVRLWFDKS